ncbi:MAG: hypothetical protein VX737_03020 [Pseudomonadota bacterium]|nr:hypothetical protein [Pseudomonadota bacterium]
MLGYLFAFFDGGDVGLHLSGGGDALSLNVVYAAYQEKYQPAESDILEYGYLHEKLKLVQINPQHQYKMVFVGQRGAKALSESIYQRDSEEERLTNLEVIWVGHQLVDGWQSLPVDTWYVPEHALTDDNRNTMIEKGMRFKTLPGVPTGEPLKPSQETGSKHKEEELIWMLSGDAPKSNTSAGNLACDWLLLDPTSYAQKVVTVLRENPTIFDASHISLCNGPRTGKFKESSKEDGILEETDFHTKALDKESNIDPVTASCVSQIDGHLSPVFSEPKIFHFWKEMIPDAEGKTVVHSEYNRLMQRFLNGDKVQLLVPGESVTDISKLISSQYCIDHRDRVFVVLSDTMTPEILSWVMRLHYDGYFNCIVARKGQEAALLSVEDTPKPAVKDATAAVRSYLDEISPSLFMALRPPCAFSGGGPGCSLM